jgi:hypothetical protein
MAEAGVNPEEIIKKLLMNELKTVFLKENINFDEYEKELKKKRTDIDTNKKLKKDKLSTQTYSSNKDIINLLYLNILGLIRQELVIVKNLLNFYKRYQKEFIIIINNYKKKNNSNIQIASDIKINFTKDIEQKIIDLNISNENLEKEEAEIHNKYFTSNISPEIYTVLDGEIKEEFNKLEKEDQYKNFDNEIEELEKNEKILNDKISELQETEEKEKKNLLKSYSELLVIKQNKLKKFNKFFDILDIHVNKMKLILKKFLDQKKINMAPYNEKLFYNSLRYNYRLEIIKEIEQEIKDIQKEINKLKPDNILDIYNYHDQSIFMNILHTKRKEYINNIRRLKEKFKK